jgi:hypothetical protein
MASPELGPMAALPAVVRARLAAYTAELDRALPGRLEGLYVVGSIALGDFRDRLSNVDAVAVGTGAWRPEERAAARPAQGRLDLRRPAQVLYVTWADLAADPRPLAQELANPFTWRLLRDDAMVERGPDYPDIWGDDAAMVAWARTELVGAWGPWLSATRHRPYRLLLRRAVTDRVLGAAQLYQATQGLVLAKTAAAKRGREQLGPKADRVLRDSTGYREGSRTSMYWGPLERRRHALELIADIVDRAASTADGG